MVPRDDVVGDMPNADDPCDNDDNSSAEERRRNNGAVLGRGVTCGSATAREGEGAGTISVGGPEGEFLINNEDDRGRPRPGVALLASRVFARTGETGGSGEKCESICWDCEMGIGETGGGVTGAGVSRWNANDDDERDRGVPAGEAVMASKSGENCAMDVEGRRGREGTVVSRSGGESERSTNPEPTGVGV